MISNKKTVGRVAGVIVAGTFGSLIAASVHSLWRGMPTALTVLLFICLWVGCYFAGLWMQVERPAELDRKFPISSKELRSRKKKFYDWVESLGRR